MTRRAARTVPLGRRGLTVTRLGLGTGPLGLLHAEADSDAMAEALVQRAWDYGLRFFDTAPLYGFGFAERCVGAALDVRPRDAFVLSTKVGRLVRRSSEDGVPEMVFDFSAQGVHRSLEASLERLGLDRVDVIFVHDPDDHYDEALHQAFPELLKLRARGVIDAFGAGMNEAKMSVQFARRLDVDCILLAGRYTLLDQSGLAELLPLCDRKGIALVIGAPYNGGILTEFDHPSMHGRVPTALLEKVRGIREVCEHHGVPLKAAALQFPFGHSAVVSVLTGPRSVAELDENVQMLEWDIPPDLWRDLRAKGLIAAEAPTPSLAAE